MNWKIPKKINQIQKGRKIYKKLRQECKNHVIYISQHPAIGDAFLIGSYLKNCIDNRDVLTFIGKASKEVYELYEFNNLVELSQSQTDCLISYLQFMEVSEEKAIILHYQALVEHTGIAFQFNGIHGLCFADLIERIIFRKYDCNDRVYPTYKVTKKYNIEKNKSVIFFPYANTLYTPSLSFWDKLIDRYILTGKEVYTYVYGDERPLDKTRQITCSIKNISSLVEYAGEVVGVRNGIMDLISQTGCKKTVYYPRRGAESWIHGSIIDFWSLNKFGYMTDCKEIEWDE